jgi:hypothetical protein
MTQTTTITSAAAHDTVYWLRDAGLDVEGIKEAFVVIFDDVDMALDCVKMASARAFANYVRQGGNARNKRAFGSQFAAVTKALRAAA